MGANDTGTNFVTVPETSSENPGESRNPPHGASGGAVMAERKPSLILKDALLRVRAAAKLYEKAGFKVIPGGDEVRHDIIQAVELGSPEALIAFCEGIQNAAPVDSYAKPVPGDMPGYDSKVIMAAGAFIQGSSIELSADGPLREPYAVYFQGGLTWHHAKFGILNSVQKLYEKKLIELR